MLFNSLGFIFFFTAVFFLFYAVPVKWRRHFLLAAGYVFFLQWEPRYVILLLAITVTAYATAALMAGKSRGARRALVAVCLAVCLGGLAVFKYYNFFIGTVNDVFGFFDARHSFSTLNLLLPLGISFFSFKAMSYTIDVYRGKIEAERDFGLVALYVSFFPQLASGPIDRAPSLLPQLKGDVAFDYDSVTDGLKLMAWGFFKKLVIADRLALYADRVFDNPQGFEGLVFLVAMYFFTFQIYCDFSGYTDIAIGAAQMLGYRSTVNFIRPYHSATTAEFWRRWHITLSTWFRDYLYIPLGGNRASRGRWYANLMIVFLLSGLWHGANWTFIAWGGLHGLYLVTGALTKNARDYIKGAVLIRLFRLKNETVAMVGKFAGIVITFHLVAFAWIFFRARDLGTALQFIRRLPNLSTVNIFAGLPAGEFFLMTGLILIMEAVHLVQTRGSLREMIRRKPVVVRWALYHLLVFLILIGIYKSSKFIYVQF